MMRAAMSIARIEQLRWASPVSTVVVLLALGAAAALTVYLYRRSSGLPRGVHVALGAARLVVLAIVVLVLFEPAAVVTRTRHVRRRLRVLVDISESMSVKDQRRAVECGAVVEHCLMALTACCGPFLSTEAMIHHIRQVGPEHIVLSSDFGQAANGPPMAALTKYLNEMRSKGLTPQDIHTMMVSNPARLLIQANDSRN